MSPEEQHQTPLSPPVTGWIEAFNKQDLATIVSLYCEDAELFDAGMRRPRQGQQEIERWFRLRFRSMPENVYAPHANLFLTDRLSEASQLLAEQLSEASHESGVVARNTDTQESGVVARNTDTQESGVGDLNSKPQMNGEQQVVVFWTLYGRGPRLLGLPGLARPFQVEGHSTFTLRQNRIYRQRGDYDHLAVLHQLLPPLRWLPTFLTRAIYYLYLWRHRQL